MFRVMPFGLTNAPVIIQRLMDMIISGLNLEICFVYFDDIIVFASGVHEHLKRLRAIFERFCEQLDCK